MRKIMMVLCLSLMLCGISQAKIEDAQKFTVTFTVKFNSLTLAEASDKEVSIRKRFKDAYSISAEVTTSNDLPITDGTLYVSMGDDVQQ